MGAAGGIGTALTSLLCQDQKMAKVIAISRQPEPPESAAADKLCWIQSDSSEPSIAQVCRDLRLKNTNPEYIILTQGVLHDQARQLNPEKRFEQLDRNNLQQVFDINTFTPLLWLKELSRLLNKQSTTRIAVLSARVGSIEDNRLGGWYSYRASKAALNMLLKTLSIEFQHRFPSTSVVAYHPGTTRTALSAPFLNNVDARQLLNPDFTAQRLLDLLSKDPGSESIKFRDWKHEKIDW